ncbi:MAG: serine hydrolase [Acidobacteria bacterium]|nr:serine hydrolase [Acidobacteriota bacterium]
MHRRPSPLPFLRESSSSFPLLFLFLSSILFSLSSCTTIPASLHVTPEDQGLARRVAKLAAGSGAHMGFVALHVESGRRFELNAAEQFEAASVIKIALLAEAAARDAEGTLDLTDRWRLTAKSLAAGSGMLDEFDPGLTPTNRDLLSLMIAISDNTSANHFIDLFGADAVNARMARLGLPDIRLVGRIPDIGKGEGKWAPLGVMTPNATAEYYRRVATRTLLDPASDRVVAKLLAVQHTKDRLPRLLLEEKGSAWAGKTGSYGGVRNDSGILTTKKGRFVLVAFADRIPDQKGATVQATRAMGEIAAAIVNAWAETLPDVAPPPEPPAAPALRPAVPRMETTLAEARAATQPSNLVRVYRDTDRRFWDAWALAGGETRDACLIPMPNTWWEGFRPSKIEPVSALILHHTSQATDEECIALFQKPESRVSSHFLVGRDGRLYQFVSLEHRAWHAGPSTLHGRLALNRTSVGVEVTGDGNLYPFTPAQIETVVRLVGVLTAMFDIPAPWIAGHQHIAPDRKDDPGALFPWNDVVRRGLEMSESLRKMGLSKGD